MINIVRALGSNRRRIEHGGLLVTGMVCFLMLTFILLYWLRDYAYFSPLYDQFLIFGAWMDYVFGTNVFRHPFMWQSLATGIFVGIAAPLIGVFLVHREMALIGETLAHTAFAGIAVGVLVSAVFEWRAPLLLVALVVSIFGALGVQWLADRTSTYGDVPIAIMLSGSFAVGTLLISYGRGMMALGIDIESYLFGSIAVVTVDGARMMTVITFIVVGIVITSYKELLFITFDERAARVAQLNVGAYNTLLIVMTAVVVVGAMQVLGVILVAAMLVIPVAAASQIANSFRETLYLSIIFGELSIISGFGFSIYLGLPSGGSIVVMAIGIYLLCIGISNRSVLSISTY